MKPPVQSAAATGGGTRHAASAAATEKDTLLLDHHRHADGSGSSSIEGDLPPPSSSAHNNNNNSNNDSSSTSRSESPSLHNPHPMAPTTAAERRLHHHHHPVTTTTTTTSGGSGSATVTNNSSSDGDTTSKPPPAATSAATAAGAGEGHHSTRIRHSHSHHSHHHHEQPHTPWMVHSHRQGPHTTTTTTTTTTALPSTTTTSPTTRTGGTTPEFLAAATANGTTHASPPPAALVMAHRLPVEPVVAASSDSASALGQAGVTGTTNGNESSNSSSSRFLVDRHKEPGFHKIKSSFQRLSGNSNNTKNNKKKRNDSAPRDNSNNNHQNNNNNNNNAPKTVLRSKDEKGIAPRKLHKLSKRSHLLKPPQLVPPQGATPKEPATAALDSLATTSTVGTSKPNTTKKTPPLLHAKKGDVQSFGASSSSGSEDNNSSGPNHSSSGSGTEGGYAASASSNDVQVRKLPSLRGGGGSTVLGGRGGTGTPEEDEDYSCSSPSGSSSEDNATALRHSKRGGMIHNKGSVVSGGLLASHGAPTTTTPQTSHHPTGGTTITTTTTRPLLSRKNHSSELLVHSSAAMTSSDLADFSSGATESKLAKTMKALQDDDDDDDDDENEPLSSAESVSSNSSNMMEDDDPPPPTTGEAARRTKSSSTIMGHSTAMIPKNHKSHHHLLNSKTTSTTTTSTGDRKRRAPGYLPRSFHLHSNNNNTTDIRETTVSAKMKQDENRRGSQVPQEEVEVSPLGAKRVRLVAEGASPSAPPFSSTSSHRRHYYHHGHPQDVRTTHTIMATTTTKSDPSSTTSTAKPLIMRVGSDVMAHILTFLEPPEVLSVLTMPLSKEWIATYTRQSELWRVLCLLEPFKAQVEEDPNEDSSSSDESMFSGVMAESELRLRYGKFRLLYSSFIRCMRYLARIKDDALSGRQPSMIDYGTSGAETSSHSHRNISSNQNLQDFLARARGVVAQNNNINQTNSTSCQQEQQLQHHLDSTVAMESLTSESSDEDRPTGNLKANSSSSSSSSHDCMNKGDQTNCNARGDSMARRYASAASAEPIGVADDGRSTGSDSSSNNNKAKKEKRRREKQSDKPSKKRKIKYGSSKLTQRLLLPAGGVTSNTELPWSCAIYSIVNWMVCFADVEGMQTMCLKVLPFLLEDEQQRMTAQRAGLTDVVLRDMVLFPHSVQLHTAVFHTIVLLARPLGGREGMLFHSSMVNSSGIFSGNNGTDTMAPNVGSVATGANGKSGIAVLLDSMRRFQANEILQAMSCWSLVNIALAPAQKDVLIKLGGVEVTTNAMTSHPHSAEVQFRALFALINLVIPCQSTLNENGGGSATGSAGSNSDAGEDSSVREVLDEMVEQIVELVVLAMKNFCSNESILNRACLVLHNLSLTADYHSTLLWTPSCYAMLEWCLSNYRNDQVLQQSAAGTLHRLQLTLSSSENLRSRFYAAVASQQQLSLEQAHNEAVLLHEEQERQLQRQNQEAIRVRQAGND